MKLSEAIRLGAMLHEQCAGMMELRNSDGDVIATCALGSARAAGFPIKENRRGYAVEHSADESILCPLRNPDGAPCRVWDAATIRGLYLVIAHLNDVHEWTREQIADWVETVERDGETREAPPSMAISAASPSWSMR